MNQRFNAHDLWTRVCQEEMPELDESCMTMQRTRKFAELIVQECIAQCEKNVDHEYLGWGSKLSACNIKHHFGVKS